MPKRQPRVVEVDGDTVRVYCPESDTTIAISFELPDMEARDEFHQSGRTWEDFKTTGGQMVIEPPAEVLNRDERKLIARVGDSGNQGGGTFLGTMNARNLAAELGVSASELADASETATVAYLNSFGTTK
ncbi:MAG TPA: hypothetical protein VFY28_02780 [Candidatus Paceibacterota bacterium]|nr:hypothetical protein [Candidatus Paceibacterota bacterium]